MLCAIPASRNLNQRAVMAQWIRPCTLIQEVPSSHYVTVVFKSVNIILVSPHIHRTEICQILPSVRRELRNMIEGDSAASRPLCRRLLSLLLSL